MRVILLFAWMAVPIAGVAFHYGPGQELIKLDDVASVVAEAEAGVADKDWLVAIERYDEALKQLPGDQTAVAQHLRLERAKAQMQASKLPEARRELENLVRELETPAEGAKPAALLPESREALANSQFYLTWLMRLEGKQRAEWEPQIEAARQNYRVLAEQAQSRGDAKQSQRHREDLESSIRLSRLEIQDLQGLPLPSQ
jgi:hypothetical protein